MRTQYSGPADRAHRFAATGLTQPSLGGITELRYSEQPGIMPLLLLPVLKQLSTQSRWQLADASAQTEPQLDAAVRITAGKEYAYYGIRAFKHG